MGLGNRQSQHSFAQTPAVNMGRSQFNRSFGLKDTFDFDYLIPIFVDEAIPGDTYNVSMECFARLATPIVPIMDNMYMDFFFFFVPNRLVWTHWEQFCGAQDDPDDTIAYTIPTCTQTVAVAVNSLQEKMGIPVGSGITNMIYNALPQRGYNLIWNKWFRDGNWQDPVVVDLDDGPDTYTDYVKLKRGVRHDYFTSCLPSPQKGTAINLLPAAATVTRTASAPKWISYQAGADTHPAAGTLKVEADGDLWNDNGAGGPLMSFDPNGGLVVAATAAGTINQLRQAFQVQSLLELDNRGGTRYVEILLAHYNVVSPDFRLQRPEYLGGGEVRINTHPVPQTSPTSGSNYQGNLAAFGTAGNAGKNIGFTKSIVEHGYVIGMACARGEVSYQQGLERMWSKSTRYDFFWPKLQEIGEQAVTTKELVYQVNATYDDVVLGYQERYAEYKYKPSQIHGAFRSNYASNIDEWHLASYYGYAGSTPTLESIITQATPIDRCVAAAGAAPALLFDAWFEFKHARPMLTYSVPAGLGRM